MGLNMPALSHCTYHSKQVESIVGGRGWESVCVWHVNSNQDSNIHQALWQAVRINLTGKGGLANTSLFLFPSAAASLTFTLLSSLHHCLHVLFCSSIYFLSLTSYALSLPPSLWLFIILSPPLHPLCVAVFPSVCHQAVINQCFYLVGGKWCERWWSVPAEEGGGQMAVMNVCRLWQGLGVVDTDRRTKACMHIKSLSHAKYAWIHSCTDM